MNAYSVEDFTFCEPCSREWVHASCGRPVSSHPLSLVFAATATPLRSGTCRLLAYHPDGRGAVLRGPLPNPVGRCHNCGDDLEERTP